MSVQFRIGYCVNCGAQVYVCNFRGEPMAPMLGMKTCWIVLSNDAGRECRVGTIMFCNDCDITKVNIDDIKATLFESPISGIKGTELEWTELPNARLELVKEFKPERY